MEPVPPLASNVTVNCCVGVDPEPTVIAPGVTENVTESTLAL